MGNNITISQRAKDIVKKFVEKIGDDAYHRLIVSMFALQQNEIPNVLSALEKYRTNLNLYLTIDEIEALLNEYKEVVKFCAVIEGGLFASRKLSYDTIPLDIVDLCLKIIDFEPSGEILLANSNLGQFSLLNRKCKCYGYEGSQEIWAFSQILLDAFEIQAEIQNCYFEDALSIQGKQYDYIFALIPLNLNRRSILNELNSLVSNYLKDNGQMCLVLSNVFTFGDFAKQFRELIVSPLNNLNVEVFALPNNIDGFGFLYRCFLHLKKDKSGKVTLIDATQNFLTSKSKDDIAPESLSLADNIIKLKKENNSKYVWHGVVADLKDNYILLPSYYLVDQYLPIPNEGEKLVELSELVEFIPCEKNVPITKRSAQPTISVRDLTTNYWNCYILQENVQYSKRGDFLLSEDALLSSYLGESAKVAKFTYNGQTLGLNREIIPFRLKSNDIITEEFLLRALTLEETLKQAKSYTNGIAFMHFKKDDFLKLKIIVPSIEKQNEICREDSRIYLSEADKKLLEEHEDFRRDMHMKKHAIGQTIHDFRNWWDILQKVRIQGNGNVNDNAVIGITKPISVSNIYDNLEIALSRLEKQIYSMDRGNGMVVDNIALTKFIEEYIQKHQNPLFKYEYESMEHYWDASLREPIWDETGRFPVGLSDNNLVKDGTPREYAKFPREALEIIFDNIISNACEHGFANRKVGNKIKIDVSSKGTKYILSIANNGEPINSQLSSKDVFTYGKTSKNGKNHFGIGGYEILRLMREFNGDVELILSPDAEYTVTYNLIFNDTDIIFVGA